MNGNAILLCAAILALTSCSRAGTEGDATGPRQSADLGVEMSSPSYPEGGEARVVSREGAVEVLRGPDSGVPESETLLALGDRVRTGADGTVELRLGDLANILLLPGTEFELRSARLTPGVSGALLFLASGTALFDVRPLASRESFVVSTSRLLAGVRGTRFLVTAGESSTAAVREGRVAVLPAGPTLERLVRAAAADAAAREALQTLTALAPDAGPGREIRVDGAA